jgi:hypothetical protein
VSNPIYDEFSAEMGIDVPPAVIGDVGDHIGLTAPDPTGPEVVDPRDPDWVDPYVPDEES